MNGGNNSQVGLAKNIKVYPGDKIKIDAYAKYYNPQSTASNLTNFAAALTGAFGVNAGSTGEQQLIYQGLNGYGTYIGSGSGGGSVSYPKAFVTILLFDKDYKFLDAAWDQIDGGEQIGASPKVAHDLLSKEVTVREAGYAFVYISNENPTYVEVYFDDVSVTHTPSNVIQYNEYYPFGLQTAQSWTRDGNKNDYLYNAGNELNSNSQWYETFFRGYDPALGKFLQVDPMADKYASATTYNYAFNNPVVLNDPMGDDANNPARGFQWWRYNQNGTPRDKGMQDAHAGGMAQQGGMYGSGYASSKSLSSLVNYLLKHTTDGGTWQNGMYRIFTSSTDAYTSAVGWGGPQIYNYFCDCMVSAHDVLATDPTNQNKNFRAWAQTAVNIYNTRAQLYNGIADAHQRLRDRGGKTDVGLPLISDVADNTIGLASDVWGAPISLGVAEAARTVNYTANALKTARVLGNTLGVAGFIPTAYNTAAKTLNGTSDTADYLDFGVSGGLLVTGFLVSNPIGLSILAVGGIGYGIYRIGWGDEADKAINERFGFRD